MRICEVLSGAISLTKQEDNFNEAIVKSIDTVLMQYPRWANNPDFLSHKQEVDENQSIRSIWQSLAESVYSSLERILELNLAGVTQGMFGNNYIPFTFANIRHSGETKGLSITLSDRYLIHLVKIIQNFYYEVMVDTFSSDSLYNHAFSVTLDDSSRNTIVTDSINYASGTIEDLQSSVKP